MILQRYPYIWLWLLSSVAWIFLILIGHEHHHGAHHCHHDCVEHQLSAGLTDGLFQWGLMIVAMMFPLLREQLCYVASRYPVSQRNWAMLWFLAGYCIPWIGIGILLQIFTIGVNHITAPIKSSVAFIDWEALLPIIGFAIAAIWVWSPMRRRANAACSRTIPMRINGYRAIQDCLHYGNKTGLSCIRNCWSPMLALIMSQHNLFLMLTITLLLVYERELLNYKNRFLGYVWSFFAVAFLIRAIL